MDTFSHGLWSFIIFRTHPWLAVLAGTLPDVIAFTPAMLLRGTKRKDDFINAWNAERHWTRTWAERTYNVTHSLIIATAVIAATTLFFGMHWWLLAWPLHILIDIPTHQRAFFPTPFLWPVSTYTVNGISWANAWFMTGNALALIIVYGITYLG